MTTKVEHVHPHTHVHTHVHTHEHTHADGTKHTHAHEHTHSHEHSHPHVHAPGKESEHNHGHSIEELHGHATPVYADKTIDTLAVRQLEYEDFQWVFEGGMPMPDYGVTVFEDGSWHLGAEPCCIKYETSGQDLQSLFHYLAEKGLLKE